MLFFKRHYYEWLQKESADFLAKKWGQFWTKIGLKWHEKNQLIFAQEIGSILD